MKRGMNDQFMLYSYLIFYFQSGKNPLDSKKIPTSKSGLIQSEERFKLLVESISDYAIFILDIDGHIQSWNAGAERFKGYKAHEVIGKHFSIFYTQTDIDRNHPQNELKIATQKGIFEEEGWRVRKDGSTFWANVVITKLKDSSGTHIGFAKVTRDLTEKKLAEEKLKESEERYRLLVSSVKDYAIFMLNPDGTVATWNEGAQQLKGYLPEEIIGKHFSKFYPEKEKSEKKPEWELTESERSGRFEDEGWRIRKDGTYFWANVIITPVRNKEGKLLGFTKVTRDTTARKLLEEKLRQSNEDLEQRVKERTTQLEKAIQFRDDFISIVSHELRTPVTSLKLQVQTALRQFTKAPPLIFHEKSGTFFQRADKQLDRISILLNDILDISRISMDRLHVEDEEIEINEIVNEVVERFEEQARSIGSNIQFKKVSPVTILGDRMRLEQVFSNLITNALKYGDSKPIEISIKVFAEKVGIAIKDQGIGVAPEDQERIFERFERATNRNIIGGIGVGLFISKKIVEAHNGEILIKSELGKGSTFTVMLNRSM